MRLATFFVVFLSLLISGCGSESAAKNALKNLLNDPGSAEFYDLKKGSSDKNVCGFFNAKNRMGGYVGKTPFFYVGETETVVISPSVTEDDFKSLWRSMKLRSDFSREWEEMNNKCKAISEWKSVCGTEYPLSTNELCNQLISGSGAGTYLVLRKKFEYY